MDKPDLLTALSRDGEALLAACERAGVAAPVASCPGWSVADLAWHVGRVLDFWSTIVGDRRDTWEGYDAPTQPADEEVIAFARDGLAHALQVLAAADPAQANWTWSSDRTAGFVIRRLAQEIAVHRWDAEHAAGSDHAIEPTLASDGIDEFLHHFRDEADVDAAPVGGSVHLHCTDVAGEWTVRLDDAGAAVVTREHAKGDAAIRGAASEILLALWRRRPLSTVDVVGDAEVAARFVAFPSLA
jgi:uncharacterized protein (TIGR03083 family)